MVERRDVAPKVADSISVDHPNLPLRFPGGNACLSSKNGRVRFPSGAQFPTGDEADLRHRDLDPVRDFHSLGGLVVDLECPLRREHPDERVRDCVVDEPSSPLLDRGYPCDKRP